MRKSRWVLLMTLSWALSLSAGAVSLQGKSYQQGYEEGMLDGADKARFEQCDYEAMVWHLASKSNQLQQFLAINSQYVKGYNLGWSVGYTRESEEPTPCPKAASKARRHRSKR